MLYTIADEIIGRILVPFLFDRNISFGNIAGMFLDSHFHIPTEIRWNAGNLEPVSPKYPYVPLRELQKYSKYIIVHNDKDQKMGMVFPQFFLHKSILYMLKTLMPEIDIYSAGFLMVFGGECSPLGGSTSLEIYSKPSDATYFNSQFESQPNTERK